MPHNHTTIARAYSPTSASPIDRDAVHLSIPETILRAPFPASGEQKIAYGMISNAADAKGYAAFPFFWLAEAQGRNERSARTWVQQMAEHGWIDYRVEGNVVRVRVLEPTETAPRVVALDPQQKMFATTGHPPDADAPRGDGGFRAGTPVVSAARGGKGGFYPDPTSSPSSMSEDSKKKTELHSTLEDKETGVPAQKPPPAMARKDELGTIGEVLGSMPAPSAQRHEEDVAFYAAQYQRLCPGLEHIAASKIADAVASGRLPDEVVRRVIRQGKRRARDGTLDASVAGYVCGTLKRHEFPKHSLSWGD